jgi:hypothetical protein
MLHCGSSSTFSRSIKKWLLKIAYIKTWREIFDFKSCDIIPSPEEEQHELQNFF